MNQSLKWYALQSHPRKEAALHQYVLNLGLDSFFPQIHAHPVNPRARKMLPYFPGYLFVHLDLSAPAAVSYQWMPFSTGMVSFGGEPAVVPDAVIEELQNSLELLNRADASPEVRFKPGDALIIRSGPLAGYEAIFDVHLNGSERVRVLLKLLAGGREISVDLKADQLGARNEPGS